jgi:aspartyl-tRNA(Asn)/glutamyl-tRNA(Gln) amidotransferase subunit B
LAPESAEGFFLMPWESVIGLEVHVQLRTDSKIFSGASTAFGAKPNVQACEVDIALPGVLPVMNRTATLMAVRFGLATGATVNRFSVFARKNYFYPDLPKGYQISQYELPIVTGGQIEINAHNSRKTIGITRAHLEEDAGKLLHQELEGRSGIDLNRAGIPLLEVVSEPDLRSPTEAITYLKKLHTLVRYLGICDGNMQEGSFRCDANVSVRPAGEPNLGTRCELKNLNSFRFIEKGLQFEINRQIQLIEDGGQVAQETRLYDPAADLTRPMRGKEDAHDYRYFPDPDLPPLVVDDELLATARSTLPELPDARCHRFSSTYRVTQKDAELLTSDRELADYFEQTVTACGDSRSAANWITGEWMGSLNRDGLRFQESRVTPQMLGDLIAKINNNSISGKIAKEVFDGMWNGDGNASEIISARNLEQITNVDEIEQAINQVIDNCADQVMQYRSGQEKVFGFLVGQVMQATGGKANPKMVNKILRGKLSGE